MIQGHGDDLYKYANIVSNFSSNIYTKMQLQGLQQYLCSRISSIHSYPEPDAHSLAQLLSAKQHIDVSSIITTNGATEAIYQIAQLFKKRRATILTPTFSEYEDACRLNGMELSFVKTLQEVVDHTQLLWFCNPNNPTGTVISKETVRDFVEKHPDIAIVIDQSYAHFTRKEVWTAAEAVQHKNVILLHSMTKRYAIPGLRLGYITAHSALAQQLRKYSMPWSVNQLAVEAGKYLLSEESTVPQLEISAYLDETKRLSAMLGNISGLIVLPTDTHFFLCRLENGRTAAELKEHLAVKHSILIRDAANFRGLDERYFRIATQSEEENSSLVNAIEQWM